MPSAYNHLEASLHDAFWSTEGDSAELPLLAAFLSDHPGRSLEIGCGSGRLLLPLLLDGHPVEGLDNSTDMLRLCRFHAAPMALDPVLHGGDMDSFAPSTPYSSLLLPAFTFQHSPDPAATLAHFARILEPGGALYLSSFLPLAELTGELPENEWFPDHETTLPDGCRATLETRHRIDHASRTLTRDHHYQVFAADGTRADSHHSTHALRWFETGELDALLESNGFTVTRHIAEFDPAEDPDHEPQILTTFATSPGSTDSSP